MDEKFIRKSVYDCAFDANLDKFNSNAFEYFGNKVSYLDFFVKVEEVYKSFRKIGIGKGDVVSICLANTPEVFYIFFALNKLGAIVNVINPTVNTDIINEQIENNDSKMIIYFDILYPKLVNLFNYSKIDSIVSVPLSNSFQPILKAICDIKDGIENIVKEKAICDKKITTWDEFTKIGIDFDEEELDLKDKLDLCCAYVYDNGKKIELTNRDILSKVNALESSKVSWDNGDILLGIMPPYNIEGFYAYLLAFCSGMRADFIPDASINHFDDYILSHKPNHILCNKIYLNNFVKSQKLYGRNLSYLENIFVCDGDLPPINEEIVNALLHKHHSFARVSKSFTTCLDNLELQDKKLLTK